jgi:hypothetical protein
MLVPVMKELNLIPIFKEINFPNIHSYKDANILNVNHHFYVPP